MNIPLFEYKSDDATNTSLYSQWCGYVCEYFPGFENDRFADNIKEALLYNLDKSETPISITAFKTWNRIIEHAWVVKKADNVAGCVARHIYEHSDKELNNALQTKMLLLSISDIKESISFLNEYENNDFSLFDNVYLSSPQMLIDICLYLNPLDDNADVKLFNTLVPYIYSEKFLNNCSSQGIYQLSSYTQDLIPYIINSACQTNEQRLNFIVHAVYLNERNIFRNDEFKQMLFDIFVKQYPEEFKKYETLMSLGVVIKPSEMLYQLENKSLIENTSISLPELS